MKNAAFAAIFCTVSAATGQTVLLSPKSIVEYAIHNNVEVQNLRYSHESSLLGTANSRAGLLPTVSAWTSYQHVERPATVQFGEYYTPVPADNTDQARQVVVPIVNDVISRTFPSRTIDLGPQENWRVGIGVRQPILAGGTLINGYRLAVSVAESDELIAQRATQTVRARALQMFWAYVGFGEAIKVTRDNIVWIATVVADQTEQVHEGMILESELYKMKTQLLLAQLGERRELDSARTLEDDIKDFCRISRSSTFVIDSNSLLSLGIEGTAPVPDTERILNARADVRALAKRIEACEYTRKIQLGAYLPNLSGNCSYDFTNSDISKPDQLIGGWTIGAALDWTLWDWGSAYRSSQQTGIAIAQLKLALETKKDSIRSELASVCRIVDETVDAQKLALESVDNARQVLNVAELRYKEGETVSADLLSASRDLTQARMELVRARIERALALEQYKLVAGEE